MGRLYVDHGGDAGGQVSRSACRGAWAGGGCAQAGSGHARGFLGGGEHADDRWCGQDRNRQTGSGGEACQGRRDRRPAEAGGCHGGSSSGDGSKYGGGVLRGAGTSCAREQLLQVPHIGGGRRSAAGLARGHSEGRRLRAGDRSGQCREEPDDSGRDADRRAEDAAEEPQADRWRDCRADPVGEGRRNLG